jgi:diglucosylglycerate octanoyltransferase
VTNDPAGPDDDTPLRLVVLGDSTSFTDATGPQLPDHPELYPNVAARHLQATLGRKVEVTTVARAGQTVREAARTVTKDRHVQFEVVAHADAVIIGVGSFDHAPAGVPAAVEALVPYLRPTGLRRRVRSVLRGVYPWLVRCTGGRRSRTPPAEFDRLFTLMLEQVRGLTWGRAAGVVLGPTSHRSRYYAGMHPGHAKAEARHLALARAHGFAAVGAWAEVREDLGRLNPDGIHWPASTHARIGVALAEALLPQLRDEVERIGPPGRTAPGSPASR